MSARTKIAGVVGVLFLLAAACKQRASAGDPEESQELSPSGGLERVHGTKISFSEAIRLAAAHQPGFVPVAAGEGAGGEGDYGIAVFSRGRVRELSVDAESGDVTELRERPVREGSEEFAARLEDALPAAKLDLARAVEIAIARAADRHPSALASAHVIGAQIDLEGGRLVYTVTVGIDGDVLEVAVDGRTGEPIASGGERDQPEKGSVDLTFDDLPAGLLPAGWKIDATGENEPLATWKIVPDATAPSGGQALALLSVSHDSTKIFNLCWTDEIRFQNGSIEVSFKPVSGEDDQGGGLIWRAQGKDDYYVCRANPLEDNFRLYAVQNGRRTELASADARISSGAWHEIRVEHEGEHIRCWLDGDKLIDTVDSTFSDAGGIGFWTKADAVTSFDDLHLGGPEARDEDDDAEEMDDDDDGDDER